MLSETPPSSFFVKYFRFSKAPTPPKSAQASVEEYLQRVKRDGDAARRGLEHSEKDEFGAPLIDDWDDIARCAAPIELARTLEELHDTGP
eukprot:5520479-Pyramimonas_sp.AAC.1